VLFNERTQAKVYIVGTAHVSRASVEEVKEVIRFTKPTTILLELCSQRTSILSMVDEEPSPKTPGGGGNSTSATATPSNGSSSSSTSTNSTSQSSTPKSGTDSTATNTKDTNSASATPATTTPTTSATTTPTATTVTTTDPSTVKGARKTPDSSPKTNNIMAALQMARKDGVFAALLTYLYSSVKDKIQIVPGAEFRAAFNEAKGMPGCFVVFGDRPINITLKRTWLNLGLWEKVKLIYTLIRESFLDITEEDIEKMKKVDIFTMMVQELAKHFPGITQPLIYERDMYLAHTIRNCPGTTVVAVIGLGHVQGVKKYWELPIDVDALSVIPPTPFWTIRRVLLTSVTIFVGFLGWMLYYYLR